eukprot:gb/GFBE01069643.1/.p1 GENE.gb/GFBE01069643.1/~~gb/GFBE01069643.1/.p1  ORF type:complete len:622 (+),score=104.32 gb/GFBE01069643.1/:1-1866(+)
MMGRVTGRGSSMRATCALASVLLAAAQLQECCNPNDNELGFQEGECCDPYTLRKRIGDKCLTTKWCDKGYCLESQDIAVTQTCENYEPNLDHIGDPVGYECDTSVNYAVGIIYEMRSLTRYCPECHAWPKYQRRRRRRGTSMGEIYNPEVDADVLKIALAHCWEYCEERNWCYGFFLHKYGPGGGNGHEVCGFYQESFDRNSGVLWLNHQQGSQICKRCSHHNSDCTPGTTSTRGPTTSGPTTSTAAIAAGNATQPNVTEDASTTTTEGMAPNIEDADTVGEPFYIVSKLSGKCVDVAGVVEPVRGAKLQIWDCLGGLLDYGQRFVRTKNGMIKNLISGLCIDVEGAPGVANGHAIMLWDCDPPDYHNESDHFWSLTQGGLIKNNISGKCMDVAGMPGVDNGHALLLWECDDAANPNTDQVWEFKPSVASGNPAMMLSVEAVLQLGDNVTNQSTCEDILTAVQGGLANVTNVSIIVLSGYIDIDWCRELREYQEELQQSLGARRLAGRRLASETISVKVKFTVPQDANAERVAASLASESAKTELALLMKSEFPADCNLTGLSAPQVLFTDPLIQAVTPTTTSTTGTTLQGGGISGTIAAHIVSPLAVLTVLVLARAAPAQ